MTGQDQKKNNIGYRVIIILLVSLLVTVLITCRDRCPDKGESNKQLAEQNQKLEKLNLQLDKSIQELLQESDSIQSKIDTERIEIKKIEDYEKKDIEVIDGYNDNQLFLFFASIEFETDSDSE